MTAELPNSPEHHRRSGRGRRVLGGVVAGIVLAYAALLIPERKFEPPAGAGKRPFVWNQDAFWGGLEQEFLKARQSDPAVVSNQLNESFTQARKSVADLESDALPPGHSAFAALETNMFRIAPLVGASPQRVPEFAALVELARAVTKKESEAWDLEDPAARAQLYRVLFGGRMALETVMVQMPNTTALPPVCRDEPSATPAVTAQGVTFHSGDILVSRGITPVSSLIARGNDYPGNFSHAAFLHVDEGTGEATIVESLIERGVITVPFAEFLGHHRLRLMALRLRADLPALRADPQLPHRAATAALKAARQRRTPYDFSMNFRDHSAQFCSEVVSSAYEDAGVRLWMGMSFISSPTVTAWLASVGVRYFETQEPSDLEYDAQLRVVAEWRNPMNLFQAHLDDAVTDAMFAGATPRAPLSYNLLKLPLARAAKLYSAGLVALGRTGPIAEGMSPTAALRASRFCEEHLRRRKPLANSAAEFRARNGYVPPYWELLKLAKTADKTPAVP